MSRNVTTIALVGVLLFVVGCAGTKQATYPTADAAASSLVDALRSQDKTQLRALLGPDSEDAISSGDDVADHAAFAKFVKAYDEKHELQPDGADRMTLVIGSDDWPLPIPLVKASSGQWFFDTAAGEDEIVNRRIGRNELDAIQVCKAICDAQNEYAQNGASEYAWKLISDSGKKNGLYWPTAPGEPLSPLGELVADATAEGYAVDSNHRDQPHPYHGYLYRLLTSQGPHASGGEVDYVVNEKLIGGFAVLAWPADYGDSGIMTFVCDYNGNVYQKDLGEKTEKQAKAIKSFDPDPSWKKTE